MPRTSRGFELRAVLGGRRGFVSWGLRVQGRGGGKKTLPGLREDDVVEGGVALAEAGEADF